MKDPRGRKPFDLTGMVFGALKAVHPIEGSKPHQWSFLCACGRTTAATAAKVRGGFRKSCGCGATRPKIDVVKVEAEKAQRKTVRQERIDSAQRRKAERIETAQRLKAERIVLLQRMAEVRAKEREEKRLKAIETAEEKRLTKLAAEAASQRRREEALRLRAQRDKARELARPKYFDPCDANGAERLHFKLPDWFANVPAKTFRHFVTRPEGRSFIAMVSNAEKQDLQRLLDGLKRIYDR